MLRTRWRAVVLALVAVVAAADCNKGPDDDDTSVPMRLDDACTMLPTDDVARITGKLVSESFRQPPQDDGRLGCGYNDRDGEGTFLVTFLRRTSTPKADFDRVTGPKLGPMAPVDGLGEEAAWGPRFNQLAVRTPGYVIIIMYGLGDGGPGERRIAEALARLCLRRLESVAAET